MIHFNASFLDNFFQVAIGNFLPDIEKTAQRIIAFGEWAPLKPIAGSFNHWKLQIIPQSDKLCDRT
jgi:hypothetical protein